MVPLEVDEDHDQSKNIKKEQKTKKKGWVKQTKLLRQKVGSAFLGLFGQKKSKAPMIRSSKGAENDSGGLKDDKHSIGDVNQRPLSFSRFFRKRKTEKGNFETNGNLFWRQENLQTLPRVPSRVMTTRPKLKIARSMRKRGGTRVRGESESVDQYVEEREDRDGEELCKKRILMGGRCKPLEFSGTLH